MNDPLQRLYKTKLALLATVLTVAGAGLLVWVVREVVEDGGPAWRLRYPLAHLL